MIGDQQDFVGRLKSVLPEGWFPPESVTSGVLTPVLTALLNGPAWSEAWLYSLISYVQEQTRIGTATDVNLDMIAQDYFGQSLQRNVNETDVAFAARIKLNLFPPENTVAAMSARLEELTGNVPEIFEPGNSGDTGGYDTGYAPTWSNLAYNYAGGYGNLSLPFQAFITVFNSAGPGIAWIAGYYYGTGYGGGGYGVGAIEYVDASIESAQVTDAQIYETVANTQPAATIMWVRIEGSNTNVIFVVDPYEVEIGDIYGNLLVGVV